MGSVPDRHHSFSGIADSYDDSFSSKPHVLALRTRVQRVMQEYFLPGGHILELGCGTGIDAAYLASCGHPVVATDPARGMVHASAQRFEAEGHRIPLIQLSAAQLSCIRSDTFDGILSNFGALNCVSNLEHVLTESHRILRENGIFILNLINKFSVVETLAYLRHGQVQPAFRRWKRGGVSVPVGNASVLTWYHSFSALKKMIRGTFTVQSVIGLNILTPPPSFEHAYQRHPRLVSIAGSIERIIESLPVVSTLGDHYIVVLERFE